MKNIIIGVALICCIFNNKAQSQIKQVTIQASGLTCSMCSNSIYKALKSLDFVDTVKANIKTSSFIITFKPNVNISFDKLKNKVEGAGFFVAKFNAIVHFNNINISNDKHITSAENIYHFLNVKNQVLNGDVNIKILDKGFVTTKEFKANNKYTTMACYKTGTTSDCCTKNGILKGTRIYHITI